jgi:hypothetical protein
MSKPAQNSPFRISLNLLHPKETPPPLIQRFFRWLITYGRFIVIVVEIVVVSAFLMRFKLDAELDDLKRNIEKDLPYIEGLENYEAQIKQAQFRISTFDKSLTHEPEIKKILADISSEIPSVIKLTSINFEPTPNTKNSKFRINGSTGSNTELGFFINNLRKSVSFKDIDLSSISFNDKEIIFTIAGESKY